MLIIPCSRIARACLYNDKAKWIDTNGACHGGKIIWDGRYHMKYISSTSFSTSRVTWMEKGARVIRIQTTVATTTVCHATTAVYRNYRASWWYIFATTCAVPRALRSHEDHTFTPVNCPSGSSTYNASSRRMAFRLTQTSVNGLVFDVFIFSLMMVKVWAKNLTGCREGDKIFMRGLIKMWVCYKNAAAPLYDTMICWIKLSGHDLKFLCFIAEAAAAHVTIFEGISPRGTINPAITIVSSPAAAALRPCLHIN